MFVEHERVTASIFTFPGKWHTLKKWVHINGFAFPPFSIVGKVVQKLIAEETELTLIAPLWTTQHWFPKMLHHIVQDSFIIASQKSQPLLLIELY
jgi:hypothetical protein